MSHVMNWPLQGASLSSDIEEVQLRVSQGWANLQPKTGQANKVLSSDVEN